MVQQMMVEREFQSDGYAQPFNPLAKTAFDPWQYHSIGANHEMSASGMLTSELDEAPKLRMDCRLAAFQLQLKQPTLWQSRM